MTILLTIFNGIAFIFYGALCLFTDHMKKEFERYKLGRFRTTTGFFELCGGLGCLVGFFYNDFLYLFSCLGLAMLMIMGTFIRFRVGDSFIQAVPAIVLGFINCYLVYIKLMGRGML